jgi:hypothetical protein
MQHPHHDPGPYDGLECEHGDCRAPATEALYCEERGLMYFCGKHAAERQVSPPRTQRGQ